RRCLKAKRLLSFTGVQASPGLTVRFARVPVQLTVETTQLGDQVCKVANSDLLTGADVDRLSAVIVFGGKGNGAGGIAGIEEFTGSASRAPNLDGPLPIIHCLQSLADQGGNHVAGVRIKIVSGTV